MIGTTFIGGGGGGYGADLQNESWSNLHDFIKILHKSDRMYVRLSVIPSRLQIKCNIESLGGHTVTKLGL